MALRSSLRFVNNANHTPKYPQKSSSFLHNASKTSYQIKKLCKGHQARASYTNLNDNFLNFKELMSIVLSITPKRCNIPKEINIPTGFQCIQRVLFDYEICWQLCYDPLLHQTAHNSSNKHKNFAIYSALHTTHPSDFANLSGPEIL